MKTITRFLFLATAGVLLATAAAQAANDTKTVTVSATVGASAKLTLSSATVSFADADPETVLSIPADAALDITAKARTARAGAVTLTVVASDDLKSGTDTIGAAAVTWASTGTGYTATGTMNKTTAQSVGAWTGSGSYDGVQTYALANSWSYVTGSYTMTVTYTLTAP